MWQIASGSIYRCYAFRGYYAGILKTYEGQKSEAVDEIEKVFDISFWKRKIIETE